MGNDFTSDEKFMHQYHKYNEDFFTKTPLYDTA